MARTTITSDTPGTTNPGEGIHTLSIFVNNKAGVLMRICQVFARRGYNIESLVVSQGRDPHFSRMTIGLKGAPEGLEQIIKQVSKLIDVIHCYEHTSAITMVLYHPSFPVDIRHNAKIFREKLAIWAGKRLGSQQSSDS